MNIKPSLIFAVILFSMLLSLFAMCTGFECGKSTGFEDGKNHTIYTQEIYKNDEGFSVVIDGDEHLYYEY